MRIPERKTDIPLINYYNEPSILTANTYFWEPGGNSQRRKWFEDLRRGQVQEYFQKIGLITCIEGAWVIGKGWSDGEEIFAAFLYRESGKHVYKNLHVTRDGENSNITALRRMNKVFEIKRTLQKIQNPFKRLCLDWTSRRKEHDDSFLCEKGKKVKVQEGFYRLLTDHLQLEDGEEIRQKVKALVGTALREDILRKRKKIEGIQFHF